MIAISLASSAFLESAENAVIENGKSVLRRGSSSVAEGLDKSNINIKVIVNS